jgi:hypothetical protein
LFDSEDGETSLTADTGPSALTIEKNLQLLSNEIESFADDMELAEQVTIKDLRSIYTKNEHPVVQRRTTKLEAILIVCLLSPDIAPGWPDFCWYVIPKPEKCTKSTKHVPNGHKISQMPLCKIFQMAIKYINIFPSKVPKTLPK